LGLRELEADIARRARSILPKPGEAALNARQRAAIGEAADALTAIERGQDFLVMGEELRLARCAFDALLGRASTEDMLDALFGRFCIGK
jgi:tRNA modification GTPase